MKHLSELPSLLKLRRQQLDLNQKDMLMKIGMSQQQYQRIEAGGDPRLSTLLRVLEGMDLEMMLVPRDKVPAVEELLAPIFNNHRMPMPSDEQALVWNDEWEDIIRKLED
ncbi:helix-turn-helix domain-containing protein [Hafnia alvei]|uniref:Helix-turn-helix n=1 Tax=Hafnia alvei TaxID=569 RepID=A0A1C6Z1U3_HAFAL|nr:helix-turn-helix domain-containing protein [Hafnia alvei]NLS54240.1 helix-turn-helix domain-containing protein [Hafnia alvei]SCM53143.1 Helix-turn-helix [Hafnia alvei]